jgi:hypothetical protein
VAARKIFSTAALAGLQRVVGDRDRDARQEQQRRIDRGQAERRDRLEGAADRGRAVRGPGGLEFRPQEQVGREPGALAAEPRHRQLPRVVQRAEERGEEHHLGEDEPHHPHAERAVDAGVIHARLVLGDDGAEPAVEHVQHGQEAGPEDERREVYPVQQRRRAQHHDEQRNRTDDGPLAAVRDVVLPGVGRGVCMSHGVCLLPVWDLR